MIIVEKYQNYSPKELTQMVKTPLMWLSKESVDSSQVKDKSSKKVRLFKGIFDLWDYSSECILIFELITKNGAALIYIPSTILQTFSEDLFSKKFYINAVFGCSDDRLDNNSKEDILPLECKYIAVWISREKNSKTF